MQRLRSGLQGMGGYNQGIAVGFDFDCIRIIPKRSRFFKVNTVFRLVRFALLRMSRPLLVANSFGRKEKNENNEEALSDQLTADLQTRYLHRGYQQHQEETA
jgi:hypothetical protein